MNEPSRPSPSRLLPALLLVAALLGVGLAFYVPHWKQARLAAERQAIEAVLAAQVEAWNRGDLEAFMHGYWNSPELTFFSGKDITAGWLATLDRYRKRYQSEGHEMGHLAFHDLSVTLAGQAHANVRGRWHLETSKETLDGLFTLLFHKTAEGWRIVHDHTSAGQPPAPPAKPDR
jgi:beta-aspartyl-peptidase (threonine type)